MNDMTQNRQWGPFDDWDELMAAMAAGDDSLARTELIEELMRYDGVMIHLRRSHDGSTWLSYTYDDGDRPKEGEATAITYATHSLLVEDVDAMMATLNQGHLPTEESYRLAKTIIGEKLHYVLENKVSRDCRGSRGAISFEQAMQDDAIYRQIRPDGTLTFGPVESAYEALTGDDASLYRYPVPEDQMLYFFDGPRIWIGAFPKREHEFHLVSALGEDAGWLEQHRLTFAADDRTKVMATLAWNRIPTMDTYRLAKDIHKERLEFDGAGDRLIVKRVSIDDSDFERPTYENIASHDAEWPDYATKA